MPITVADIEEALSFLGGQASITQILEEVRRVAEPPLPLSARQVVRARLQENCPESGSYKGVRALFRNVHGFEERAGIWALRVDDLAPNNPDALMDAAEPGAREGMAVLRKHLRRERSRALVDAFKASLTDWSCRVCGFDFASVYGDLGKQFIEAHHIRPVATLEAGEMTRLSDLVAICSNCHRMLHRRPGMNWQDLKKLLTDKASIAPKEGVD